MVKLETDGRARRSSATRASLVRAARRLFTDHGYAAVSTTEIAQAAGVTRNALYYHFPTKEALFRAVYEDVERELSGRILPTAAAEPNFERALRTGCSMFLDACLEPDVAQISLKEAPAVLAFSQMREIDNRYWLGTLSEVLRAGIEAGELRPLPVDALAAMLIGALDEAALLIANAERPRRARREVGDVIDALASALLSPDRGSI
jgi:AcrR family transcriptional regulator